MSARSLVRIGVVAVAAVLAASACGDDGGGSGSSTTAGGPGSSAATTTLTPQAGGSLTIATYQETMGLDPIVSTGGGITGATEMAAIYDTVTRWNPATNQYEPRTADSLTPNADYTEWTVKIRPGIKFTDGTDYDAEAVQFGVNRHLSGLIPSAPACEEIRACPRNSVATGSYMSANVKSSQVIDKLTLKFTMTQSFPTFPAVLAAPAGMIPSPTAMKAACPADKSKLPRDCSFNLKPVGAGPFMIDVFNPKESITMKRNPTYWNGPVYLDGLKFVNFGDSGADKTYDALKAGSVQVAYLRSWPASRAAEADKFGGYSSFLSAGVTILLNNGLTVTCAGGQPPICAGRSDGTFVPDVPTSRLKVRQAFAAAIDPVQLDARVFDGKGSPGTELLQKASRYYGGVAGPAYDLTKAKQLVQEAKAEGWDGKIRWVCSNNTYGQQFTLAVQSMLQAAGFTVDTKLVDNVSNDVITRRDYDSACWGLSPYPDDLGFWQLFGNLHSASSSNRMGYKSAAMDAGLATVRAATNDDQKKAGYKAMAEAYLKDQPLLAVDGLVEQAAWHPSVQGIAPTVQTIILFDKAWIKK
jgi:peptide/nickel transport system substrate-binding protein